jgi:hypothetical protein
VRQQRRLAAGVRQASTEQARQAQARAIHARAVRLYKTGKRKEAIALANAARVRAGLAPSGAHLDIVERFASDLARTAYYTPGGLLSAGKGEYADVRAATRGQFGFKHTRELGKQLVLQPIRDIRHPLRHPGYTFLDALAVGSVGVGAGFRVAGGLRGAAEAGAAARAAGAGRAIAAARATRAGLTRPGYAGGSLLHRPAPKQLEIAPGVFRLEPDNPLLRLGARYRVGRAQARLEHEAGMGLAPQEAHRLLAKTVQKHTGPQAMIGRELRAMYRIARPGAEKAKQLARLERRMDLPQRTAARLTMIEGNRAIRDPAEIVARHAEQHRQWADEWRQSIRGTKTNRERRYASKMSQVNEQVARDVEASLPVLRGATTGTKEGRAFLTYIANMRRLSRRAEREAIARGHLTPEIALRRLGEVARIYRGGKVVTERAQKARRAHVREYPGRIVTERQLGRATVRETITRPRTQAEAEARLAALNQQLEGLYTATEERLGRRGAAGSIRPGAGKRTKGGRVYGRAVEGRVTRLGRPSIKDVVRQEAIDELEKRVAREPNAPWAQAYKAALAEHERLSSELGLAGEEVFATGPTQTREFGTIRQTVARPGEPAIVERSFLRRGRRVTVPAREARRARVRVEGGLGPEGLAVPRGAAYFPMGERFKELAAPVHTNIMARTGGKYGLGPPQVSRGYLGSLQRASYRGLKTGVVEKPGQAVALRYAAQHRLYGAEDLYQHARQLGTDVRRSNLQLAVRDTQAIPAELRELVNRDLEAAGEGDINALGRAGQNLRQSIVDEQATKATSIGEHVEGVRWVDKRLMKELYKPTNDVMKFAAAFNTPFRFFGIYLRPAYFMTNYPQNASMALIEQGIRRGTVNLVRARRSNHLYGRSNTDFMESEMGTARTESYLPTTTPSRLRRGERKIVETITHITDRDMRIAAFLYRAEQAGFKGKAGIRRLRTEPGLNDQRIAIVRRARRDAVDFDSMTPGEKNLVDIVYFYPWMTRATAWTGRAALNRPVKAAIAGQLGVTGQREQLGALGPIPQWLKGYIATKAGLVNVAPLFTPTTPAQIADYAAMLTGLEPNPHEASFAEQFGTPLLQALGGGRGGITAPLTQVAPTLMLQRLGIKKIPTGLGFSIPTGRGSVTFPERGLRAALGPFVFGGWYPRKPSRTQIRKQAQLEAKGRGGVGGPRERPRGYGGFGGSGGSSLLRSGGGGGGGSLLRSP